MKELKTLLPKETTIIEREYKPSTTWKGHKDLPQKLFNEAMETGIKITREVDGEVEVLELYEDEEFVRAYSSGDPERCFFPWHWFISNYGRLLSISKNGKVTWVKEDVDKEGYYAFKIPIYDEQGNYVTSNTIKAHNMVALCFGSEKVGKEVKERLLKYGRDAFKFDENGIRVTGHHKNEDVTDNRAENIQLVLEEVHKDILDKVGKSMTPEEEIEFIKDMRKALDDSYGEEDKNFKFVFTGETINPKTGKTDINGDKFIAAAPTLRTSSLAKKQIQLIINVCNYLCNED